MKKIITLLVLLLQITSIANAQIKNNKCALIAGGSKGIGYGIAEALAKRNWDLILIARHEGPLEEAKQKLETAYGIHVSIISQDLTEIDAPDKLFAYCEANQINLKMLCNVAGFGGAKDFPELPADTLRYMMRLNIESVVMMTHKFLPMLEANSPSYVLNVASMAGMAPLPIKNLYAATKAAVISFTYSLRQQVKDKDISVSCLAPGPVYTKQQIVETTHKALGKTLGDWIEVSPARVGEVTVRRTLKGRLMIVPGTLAYVASGFIRAMPLRWVAGLVGGKKK